MPLGRATLVGFALQHAGVLQLSKGHCWSTLSVSIAKTCMRRMLVHEAMASAAVASYSHGQTEGRPRVPRRDTCVNSAPQI